MGSRVRASPAGRTWGVPDDLGGIEHSVPLRLREVGGHLRPMGGEGRRGARRRARASGERPRWSGAACAEGDGRRASERRGARRRRGAARAAWCGAAARRRRRRRRGGRGARSLTERTQSCTGAAWSASAILAIVLSIMLMHFSGVITLSSPLRLTCREGQPAARAAGRPLTQTARLLGGCSAAGRSHCSGQHTWRREGQGGGGAPGW